MSKFSVDYKGLDNTFNKRVYKLSDVKDKLVKVAFDIVRFRDDDNSANLWQIQNGEDGDYIVSMYDQEEVVKTASVNPWEVVSSNNSLNIFYKGDQIAKVASDSFGLPADKVSLAESYLPKSLASNKKLVSSLLNTLPEITKNSVLNKYPELK